MCPYTIIMEILIYAYAYSVRNISFNSYPGRIAQSGASLTANQGVAGSSPGLSNHIFSLRFGHEKISTTILTIPLIQEGQLSITSGRMGNKYW